MEVYNEYIIDLLSFGTTLRRPLKVSEHPEAGSYVQGTFNYVVFLICLSGLTSFCQHRFKPRFKPSKLVWQKQVSASFCQCNLLHHHVQWQNWSFVIVCFMETLLVTILNLNKTFLISFYRTQVEFCRHLLFYYHCAGLL